MFDRVEVAEVREAAQTKLDDLAWLCRQRRLKTDQRWQLDGPPGNRRWLPPTPTHPPPPNVNAPPPLEDVVLA